MKTILKATILALTSFSGMESPMVAASLIANQSSSTDTTLMANPMLWADVPDPDVIRVGHTFYMVSTTMHLMPGAPIMQSPDLVSWTTAGYIFNKLTDSPRYNLHQGTVYGRGQWATSLKYYKGRFYALFAPNDQPGGDSYIYTTDDPSHPWTLVSRLRHFHDASLFFDDDDKVYVIYGTGQMCQLTPNLKSIVEGSDRQLFKREADETGLLEGSRMIKHDGQYYLLMISWPQGQPRRQVCYRANSITGPYQKKVILQSTFGGFPYVGQGTIVDAQDGKWYGIIFQDRNAVGRVLTLMPCQWKDGWPMLGDEQGRVPDTMIKPVQGYRPRSLTRSDDFSTPQLALEWQWNHNPDSLSFSLTERPGWLRLKTSRIVPNLYLAPNTLTQRMEGPVCQATVCFDVNHLKGGDRAGLAAFNGDSGVLTLQRKGGKALITMSEQEVSLTEKEKFVSEVKDTTMAQALVNGHKVYLRIEADFRPGTDLATFSYSTDGHHWQHLGGKYHMRFDYRRFFMGTRFALFCYATEKLGGYVDIDSFDYQHPLLSTNK